MNFLIRIPWSYLLSSAVRRHFSSAAAAAAAAASSSSSSATAKALRQVPYSHRPRALRQAKEAVTEYFHTTRSLPFSHAEQIVANSPSSLSSFLSSIPYSSRSDFPRSVRRHLSYGLINEFDFFFESIGISHKLESLPPSKSFFLSDDSRLIGVVSALVQFGFPWTDLGVLYRQESSILEMSVEELSGRLAGLERYEINKAFLIAICLAFPSVLSGRGDSEMELLLRDLNWMLVDFDSTGLLEENVKAYFKFCKRVKVFYDSGCKKGEVGELMRNCWKAFLKFEEQELLGKIDFFSRLGMDKEEAGMLLLRWPVCFELDVEHGYVRMPDYLVRAGFSKKKLDDFQRRYPYIMGRNRLRNFPEVLKALSLSRWLLEKIKEGEFRYISEDYLAISGDNKMDIAYQRAFANVKSVKKKNSLAMKLEFLQGIGFGENKVTIRALKMMNGSGPCLQERFDCLLDMGIGYSELCKILSMCPKILNQNSDMIREKMDYLCHNLGFSVHYLNHFPSYLIFALEIRIKPRYKIINWLREKGVFKRNYAPASILAVSEKRFVRSLEWIHPAAPKHWFEVFKSYNDTTGDEATLPQQL